LIRRVSPAANILIYYYYYYYYYYFMALFAPFPLSEIAVLYFKYWETSYREAITTHITH